MKSRLLATASLALLTFAPPSSARTPAPAPASSSGMPAAGSSPNPFIDPAEFKTFIARQQAAFEVELNHQQDEAAARTAKAPRP